MVRLLILIVVVALGVWGYQAYNSGAFNNINVEETIKKEKTINTVQSSRDRQNRELQDIMNKY